MTDCPQSLATKCAARIACGKKAFASAVRQQHSVHFADHNVVCNRATLGL